MGFGIFPSEHSPRPSSVLLDNSGANSRGLLMRCGALERAAGSRSFRCRNQLQRLEMGARQRARKLVRIAEGSDSFLPLTRNHA
jgi:hypothetical protein